MVRCPSARSGAAVDALFATGWVQCLLLRRLPLNKFLAGLQMFVPTAETVSLRFFLDMM